MSFTCLQSCGFTSFLAAAIYLPAARASFKLLLVTYMFQLFLCKSALMRSSYIIYNQSKVNKILSYEAIREVQLLFLLYAARTGSLEYLLARG